MIRIKDLLSSTINLLQRSRRSGTTTLLKGVASDKKAWIVVVTQDEARSIGESAVSLGNVSQIDGLEKRPLLIDSSTVERLASGSLSRIEELESYVKCRTECLARIKSEIESFESRYGKLPSLSEL